MKGVVPIQLVLIQMAVMNVDVRKVTNSQDQRKTTKRGISNLELGIHSPEVGPEVPEAVGIEPEVQMNPDLSGMLARKIGDNIQKYPKPAEQNS